MSQHELEQMLNAAGDSARIGEVRMKPMIEGFRDAEQREPVWCLVPHVIDRVNGMLVERRLGIEAELLGAVAAALEAS